MNDSESRSPTKSPSPGQSPDWRNSVESDLRKACHALEKAHDAEAEANMAVFLAEVSHDAGVAGATEVAKRLKELHFAACHDVNECETRVREVIEGDATFEPVYNSTISVYAQGLAHRSGAHYKCHTETLAARHLVAMRERQLNACKRHLVATVTNRSIAESEVARISGLYVDGTMSNEDMLEEQLAFVRNGAVDVNKERTNAHAHFAREFATHCALFACNMPADNPPPLVPNAPPHEEHDAQDEEAAKEVVNEAVRGLVERVIQAAE